jgi:hypothetical protein
LVYHDQGSASWIATGLSSSNSLSYTLSGLSNGATYEFKVAGENVMGEGVQGSSITLTTDNVPDPPTGVATSDFDASNKQVSWTDGADNGSALTGYTVYIQNQAGTMTAVTCTNDELNDGYCVVLNTELTASLLLILGDSVIAEVVATNSEGSSTASATGSGTTV